MLSIDMPVQDFGPSIDSLSSRFEKEDIRFMVPGLNRMIDRKKDIKAKFDIAVNGTINADRSACF